MKKKSNNSRKLTLTKTKIDHAVILGRAYEQKKREMFPPSTEPVDLFDLSSFLSPKRDEFIESAQNTLFVDFLLGLSAEEMRELQALMYLGRSDFSVSDFWRECDDLHMSEDSEEEASHVMSKSAVLVDYLYEGFSQLNRAQIA